MTGATIIITTIRKFQTPCIAVYKEYRRWAPTGFWSTPGGSIQKGESPINGAIRETEEETFIRFTPEQLSEPILGKNCTYFITYLKDIDKRHFLESRYQRSDLRPEQKEMWAITFVPIENLKGESNIVKDINNKDINLRDIFFADLQRYPEILEKIKEKIDSVNL
jgi:8-oxo-dGTP pyrophosphatase MutT (NUDIX family)